MKLYMVRHAEAEVLHDGITDSERQLTPKGVRRTKTAAQAIANLGLKPTHIYSSPRLRSRQTADIIAEALKLPVSIREEVNYSFDVNAVISLTADLDDTSEVMFVGHEPSMSMVVDDLTGANVEMKKGGLARVDVVLNAQPLRGRLIWLIAPRVFDILAKN